jgi:hypothetical protein
VDNFVQVYFEGILLLVKVSFFVVRQIYLDTFLDPGRYCKMRLLRLHIFCLSLSPSANLSARNKPDPAELILLNCVLGIFSKIYLVNLNLVKIELKPTL